MYTRVLCIRMLTLSCPFPPFLHCPAGDPVFEVELPEDLVCLLFLSALFALHYPGIGLFLSPFRGQNG